MTNKLFNLAIESPLAKRILKDGAIAVFAGSFAAAAGIYQTDLLGWPGVWFYWVGLIGIGVWIGGAISVQLAPFQAKLSWPLRWLIASVAITAPMLGMVSFAQTLIRQPVPPEGMFDLGIKVFIITAAVSAIRLLQADSKGEAGQPSAELTEQTEPDLGIEQSAGSTAPETSADETADEWPAEQPGFMTKLPHRFHGATLWAISAEDHYVRVHTSKGSELLLMRFADAMNETGDLQGAHVHRSWWVALAGVSAVERKAEGGTITLKNGEMAPVSRKKRDALARLKAMGPFE